MIDNHDTSTIDFLAQRPRPAANDFTIDLTETRRPAASAMPTVPTTEPAVAGELMPMEENSNFRHGGNLAEGEKNLAIDLGINLSLSGSELIHEAALDMGKAITLMVKSGLALIAAKAKCNHGEFDEHCKQIGIPQNRASEAMAYARFAAQLPDSQRGRYLLLPKRSALLLANADPEVIDFLLEDGNIELTRKVRTRGELTELARALTEAEDELETSKAKNDALQEEILRLKEAQEAHIAGSEYPLHVVVLRKEASILADEAIACLSSIRSFTDEFMLKNETTPHSQQARNLEAGIVPAMAGVASILQAANQLLTDMEQQTGVNTSELIGRITRFNEAELILIESARDTMLSRKEGKSLLRQSQYAANGETKRGRGRPKKVG